MTVYLSSLANTTRTGVCAGVNTFLNLSFYGQAATITAITLPLMYLCWNKPAKTEPSKQLDITQVSLKPGQIGPIKEVANGVFTAEACSPNGEKFHLGMEDIDINHTEGDWDSYTHAMGILNNEGGGILGYLVEKANDSKALKEARSMSPLAEVNDQEFDGIIAKLQSREIYPQGRRYEAFKRIGGGIAGFGFKLVTPTHVAYASRAPVTGKVKFWRSPEDIPFSYKAIEDTVSPIIMTVGVKLIEGKPLFQNRGIFRNYISFLNGSHSHISTLLHAFTGKVIRDCVNPVLEDQAKEYMTVAPLPRMQDILINAVGRNHLMIENEIPEKLRHSEGLGVFDTPMLIPLKNLASLHNYDLPTHGAAPLSRDL